MPKLKTGNEKKPAEHKLIPIHYIPEGSLPHLVSDEENWNSLAARYGVPAKEIIQLNFKTSIPEEINWYLREYVNCDTPTPDGYNWRFSTSSRSGPSPRAGTIFVLPNWAVIQHAARRATRDFVMDWIRNIFFYDAKVTGPALSVLRGTVGSFTNVRYTFTRKLRMSGATDALAERWADFLESTLKDFTSYLELQEPWAFPTFEVWPLLVPPPPTTAAPLRLLEGSAAHAFVRTSSLFRELTRFCKIDDPAGLRMARSYAHWFEWSFALSCRHTLARSVTAIVHPIPSAGEKPLFAGKAWLPPRSLDPAPMVL